MTWRETYKVHPAADVFPMMSDEELAQLGEDIKANGLRAPIRYWQQGAERLLIDGRNRLEAAERQGIELGEGIRELGDPIAYIISANIRRRHLTKQQQADLIVAAVTAAEKPVQVEPVSKGGRGKVNKTKAKAVAEAKKLDISEATVKRSIAKAELMPEEIEKRRKKYEEQARNRDERTRERREEKDERVRQRKSDVAEALAILDRLDLDAADRLVTLLMSSGTCADVSMALHDREMERDDARAELDEQLQAEAKAAAETEDEPEPAPKPEPKRNRIIEELRKKTIAHGCTPAEQAAALDKVAQMNVKPTDLPYTTEALRLRRKPKRAAKTKGVCKKCHGTGETTSKKTGLTVDCDCVRNGAARVRATP